MAIWDQKDYIEGAKEEGFAEGRAEGRAEGEKNMALNLYKLGIPIDMIAKGANVSADTVKNWIDSCDKTKENAWKFTSVTI